MRDCVAVAKEIEEAKKEIIAEGGKMEAPKLGQEDIRDAFSVGQNVLVRSGTEWHTREILGITVLRHDTYCPHCVMPLLGEPRFWFNDYGNVPLDEIMAKEDIDPLRINKVPNVADYKRISYSPSLMSLKTGM